MQKYVENLTKTKTKLETELEKYTNKRTKLSHKARKLRNDSYMLLIKKANLTDEFYAKMTKHTLLKISAVLLTTAALYTLFVTNPMIAIGLGAVDVACISKAKRLKKEIEDGNKVSVKLLENIINNNNAEMYKLDALIDELDYVINYKKEKINKLNKEIKKIKNIGSPKRTYEEKAKVIELKLKTK